MSVTPFTHLYRLSDGTGVFEHAERSIPRVEHGYCVDDVARALVVSVREPDPTPRLVELSAVYLRFVIDAQDRNGHVRNRRGYQAGWQDEPGLEDCWGRAVWALGSACALMPTAPLGVLEHFERSAQWRSPWSRSMAFASLGAAEVLTVDPDNPVAIGLLTAVADAELPIPIGRHWQWPESRLRYANGVLPESLLVAGHLLGRSALTRTALIMLDWLMRTESAGDRLSVTPVGGWAWGEPRPGFDQQPIEVAALADACARAYRITGSERWRAEVLRCAAWFDGANDSSTPLVDRQTGGGFDGLELSGRNENQGAESTLAMLSVMQQARVFDR